MPAIIPPSTTLEGEIVRLEPLTPDLALDLRDAIGVPEVFAGGFGGGATALDSSDEGWTAFAKRTFRWQDRPFAVRLVHSGRLVGTTTLGEFSTEHEQCHLGWTAYAPEQWGTRVNPETKLLVLEHAFSHGFSRVRIQADAANERSRAAIERLGAVFEGVLRHDKRRADGSWRDTAVYSILAEEWPAVRTALEARLAR